MQKMNWPSLPTVPFEVGAKFYVVLKSILNMTLFAVSRI